MMNKAINGAMNNVEFKSITTGFEYLVGDKELGEAVEDIGVAAVKGGVSGVATSALAGVTSSAITAATATTVGTAIAGTAGGAMLIAAAPVVAPIAIVAGVGSWISSWFD